MYIWKAYGSTKVYPKEDKEKRKISLLRVAFIYFESDDGTVTRYSQSYFIEKGEKDGSAQWGERITSLKGLLPNND